MASTIAVTAVILSPWPGTNKTARPFACVATNNVKSLQEFDRLVGHQTNCAVVFIDAVSTWAEWSRPWFLDYYRRWPQYDWEQWYRTGRGRRQLVLTVDLIPSGIEHSDWLQLGARGYFETFARTLARNLVAAGLGRTVIRLGHEANGTWYPDSVGTTPSDSAKWVQFWRRTALTMRSVRAAQFQFDWCVNAGYRPIPLAKFYPGDDVVDLIGVDAYDTGGGQGAARIAAILEKPDGLRAVAAFARTHHKPMTIPEWGIGPNNNQGAAGDDPRYVDALAKVVRSNRVAYEAYFFSEIWGNELKVAPNAIRAYRSLLGNAF